ncbi:MAG: recombinase family protein [Pirellulales bacterium]|nr:recombinase family protein [Pirellulales bacterium]
MNIPLTTNQPDGRLAVVVLGRLSQSKDTPEETQKTIDSSFAFAQEYVERHYHGEVKFKFLGEQISGMVLDRRTIREAEELMGSGQWDVLLAEDLSRIYRNPRFQYDFVQDCVDAGIRLICIADSLDTADDSWETMLGTAALRHGLFVPDTRRRIKRKAKFAFSKGGMVQKVKFGYRKLSREEANSGEFGPRGLRIAKLAEHQGVFDEIRHRLIATQSPPTVVAWLNAEGVPLGPYAKRKRWYWALLKGLLTDPLLHGLRQFRKVEHVPVLADGTYRRKKNPAPDTLHIPELAFMTREEQEAMLAAVGWKLATGATLEKTEHPRRNVPRSRTLWPGQAATCSVCGGRMLLIGKFLKCRNALKVNGTTCWNHVQAPVELIRDSTLTWLRSRLNEYPDARRALIDGALATLRLSQAKGRSVRDSRQQEIKDLVKQQTNLATAIANGGGQLQSLMTMLSKVEQDLEEDKRLQQVELRAATSTPECGTAADVEAQLEDVLKLLMATSMDFADVLKQFFSEFIVYPVQALDTGQVRPRAVLRFDVGAAGVDGEGPVEQVEVVFDLLKPPVHIGLLPAILAARASLAKPTLRNIAPVVGANYMTVKRALAYSRLMEARGMTEPFAVLTEQPDNASRWRHAS